MSINVAAIPSPFIHATIKRRKNTWYTIASGNWSDPNIWMSNGHRRYNFPQTGDDVSIGLGHVVTFDTASNGNTTINNFFIAGSFILNGNQGRVLNIMGDLQATGSVDLTTTSSIFTLRLFGVNNAISTFVSGSNSTVQYSRINGDQPIMDIGYRHLSVDQGGTKYLTNHLNIAGNLAISINQIYTTNFECGNYNLTVNGATTVSAGGYLSKTGAGAMLFVGAFSYPNGNQTQGLSLTGNPTVELRGGLSANGTSGMTWITGTGSWIFTTNTQTITLTTLTFSWTAPISIVGAITVNEAGTGIMSLNQPIDCTSSSGSVVAKGNIYFNSTSSLPSFTTGTFDRTSFANTVGYTMGASITLPYTSYSSLLVSNSGTKTSLGNTTLLGNLTVNTSSGSFDLSSFDFTVNGTTQIGGNSSTTPTLSKSGSGNVLFVGLVTLSNSNNATIDFSGGNPTVEYRGGLSVTTSIVPIKTGTGQWKFTTNSQNITGSASVVFALDCPVLISGAITVTLQTFNTALALPTGGYIRFNAVVNGDNASSTLLNKTWMEIGTVTQPMTTGVFNYSSFANSVGYIFDGNFTLPNTTYSGLYVSGTGVKTLAGNTSLTGNLAIGATSALSPTMELSAFNLTVAGSTAIGTAIGMPAKISKSGAGSVLFTGLLTFTNANGNGATYLDFSGGNPSVEVRGGISFSNNNLTTAFLSGSSTWTFSTNNQTITGGGSNINFDAPILISGAITLSTTSSTTFNLVCLGVVNGNNVASTLDNRITTGALQYQATQQPMLTGVLQTNLAANTFLYNAAGNQDVKGGTYRTLTLAGSGVKTLQGNVVVATLYTLTAPATLALNGFTRT